MSKSMSAFRGSLDLFYQVEASDGSFGPTFAAGNVTDFSISPDAEELEIIDTGNANYGQAADAMIDAKPTKFSFGVNRFNIDNWDVAFMGSHAARSAAQANVTDEAVVVTLGEMSKLAGLDISAVVIQDDSDTTTYVLDTDYEVIDAALGIIKWLSAGSIGDGDTVHIDYTTAAETGYLLSGGTESSKFLKVWGRGINRFNNKRSIINIPRASVKSSGAFSFVGTDAAAMQFDGTANIPADGGATFTIITDE